MFIIIAVFPLILAVYKSEVFPKPVMGNETSIIRIITNYMWLVDDGVTFSNLNSYVIL